MSLIHYKFKPTLVYKTLVIDGINISVPDLKRAICEKEKIRIEAFDLILFNSTTKRQYSDEELIPRNTSVDFQRLPRDKAMKLPKIKDTSTSGIVTKHVSTVKQIGHIQLDEFSQMSEEERLDHIKEISYQKYHPLNYQKRIAYMPGPPPLSYTCYRCNMPGHWIKECPIAQRQMELKRINENERKRAIQNYGSPARKRRQELSS